MSEFKASFWTIIISSRGIFSLPTTCFIGQGHRHTFYTIPSPPTLPTIFAYPVCLWNALGSPFILPHHPLKEDSMETPEITFSCIFWLEVSFLFLTPLLGIHIFFFLPRRYLKCSQLFFKSLKITGTTGSFCLFCLIPYQVPNHGRCWGKKRKKKKKHIC